MEDEVLSAIDEETDVAKLRLIAKGWYKEWQTADSNSAYWKAKATKDFVRQGVAILNEALQADPAAINELMNTRVPCNKELADHPTIKCGQANPKDGYIPVLPATVGPIGLINGLFGVDDKGWGFVVANYELACPKHGSVDKEPLAKGKKLGDPCPGKTTEIGVMDCNEKLVLGKIVSFQSMEDSQTSEPPAQMPTCIRCGFVGCSCEGEVFGG